MWGEAGDRYATFNILSDFHVLQFLTNLNSVLLGLASILDEYLGLGFRLALHLNVEVTSECLYMAQRHLIPCGGKLDGKVERVETGGTYAKQAFRYDAAIKSAFC